MIKIILGKRTNWQKEFKKHLKSFSKLTLKGNKLEAIQNKDKWEDGIPPINKPLSFRSDKVWHNGTYKADGYFYIVGDKTNKRYEADKWYLR